MIKEKEIIIKGHPRNIKHYIGLGYDISCGDSISVKVSDLLSGSSYVVTTICDNCGNETKNTFKDYYIYTKGLVEDFYCTKCKSINSEKTCIEKWGVKNPMQNDSIKLKLKESLIDKYGVDHYSKTDLYKEKFKKTCLERYGVDNHLKDNDIKLTIKKTNLEKYGVEYPMQSYLIKNKTRESNLEKYGVEHYSQTRECKEKVKKTSFENFGFENPMKSNEVKKKTKIKNLEKYGFDHISKTDKFKNTIKLHRERLTYNKFVSLFNKEYDIISYSNELFEMIHRDCGKKFSMNKGLVRSRYLLNKTICSECNPIGVQFSSIESEVRKFLDDNHISYTSNDKSLLNGKEIDIYIKDKNIAIEVNGVYWHSEFYKNKNYHLNKTNMCKSIGIDLIHIWEDDWNFKKEIIKSIILNRTGLLKNKIYARNCEIREVSSSESRKFLDCNHIQGYSSSQVKIGLYYNGELVSLMTFGWRYTNSKKEYELIRFCNKINYAIIGSASKLFSNFCKNYKVSYIISYADISMFSGGLYEKLGFEKVSQSKPNYFWVIDGVRKHRFNYSKQKLIKQGFDPNKTEVDIMHERGYYRIFSCGQDKWIYDILAISNLL